MRQLVRVLKRARMSQMRRYRETLNRLKGMFTSVEALLLEKESPDESEVASIQKTITGLEVGICECVEGIGN